MPNFDIANYYAEDDTKDLLVRNSRLGAALASYLLSSKASGTHQDSPDHCAALMRGHGYTVVGSSIEEAVLRAIYTSENATIQTTSLLLNMASSISALKQNNVQYLRDDELGPGTEMTKWSSMRPWNLWLREVESIGLYENGAK